MSRASASQTRSFPAIANPRRVDEGQSELGIAASLNILLLCDQRARHIGTVEDYIQAFLTRSRHNVLALDARGGATIDLDLERFDVVVIHYSVAIGYPGHVPASLAARIKAFSGTKIAFLQDEYRWIDASAAAIRDLGIDVLFTVTNPEVTRKIYHHPWFDDVRIEHTLTGFVPEDLCSLQAPAYEDRTIDVGYRARKLPAWLGEAGQEKWAIGERFAADAEAYGLTCDISSREMDRIYGDAWIDFLGNCRAVLGSESAISTFDFDGTLKNAVEAYEFEHPDASFDEVQAALLQDIDGRHGAIRVISPRVFEAAALKTLMILYPGSYSGVLEPWRHYLPLERDHSNMAEVVGVLGDHAKVMKIIDQCYREVARSGRWGYNDFAMHFDQVVDDVAVARTTQPVSSREADRWQRLIDIKIRREARRVAISQFVVRSSRFIARCSDRNLPEPIASRIKQLGRSLYRGMRYIARRAFLPRST